MRIKLLILTVVYLIFGVSPVYAGDPPIPIAPANNATVTSSKIEWQIPSYPICLDKDAYRVQVDDDPTFPTSSIYRNIYTKNTYYTPQLTLGTWYWRVMVRDSTCSNWSDWSTTWSFNLVASSPSPSPTSSFQTPSDPTPTPSNTNSATSSFTISNLPSEINSDQSFNVSINLFLPNNPNTNFYLKGAFKKAGSSNYFGQTKVSGNWVKNNSTYSNQFPIITDSLGNWSGNLEIKPDSEDSGFTGSGDYIFKVGRYTSTGSGPTWSNESNIQITALENTDQGGIPSDTSSTTVPSSSPPSEQSAKSKTASGKSKSYDRLDYHSATVAAATTKSDLATTSASPSPSAQIKGTSVQSILPWIGATFIFCGISSLIFIYLRSRKIL